MKSFNLETTRKVYFEPDPQIKEKINKELNKTLDPFLKQLHSQVFKHNDDKSNILLSISRVTEVTTANLLISLFDKPYKAGVNTVSATDEELEIALSFVLYIPRLLGLMAKVDNDVKLSHIMSFITEQKPRNAVAFVPDDVIKEQKDLRTEIKRVTQNIIKENINCSMIARELGMHISTFRDKIEKAKIKYDKVSKKFIDLNTKESI